MDYSKPWKGKEANAKRAAEHVEWVTHAYREEIEESIAYTTRYAGVVDGVPSTRPTCQVQFMNRDSVAAAGLFKDDGKVCILNFASFKEPGGRFLDGSMAQEEALCHASTLYPVLNAFRQVHYARNCENLNYGLYRDTALYSPDICFFDGSEEEWAVDVLTCAAPNFAVGLRYGRFDNPTNTRALEQRIRFIYDIVAAQGVDIFIAGAWGCGVFRQNPATVAQLMVQEAQVRPPCARLIFAVPGVDDNASVFRRVVEQT